MADARQRQQREDRSRCAYCGAPATGKDHVPPRNLFPENRLNLLTVPSCDAHNNERSGTDEKFLELVGMAAAANHGLHSPLLRGALKSLERNQSRWTKIKQDARYLSDGQTVAVGMEPGVLFQMGEAIARAIYWKHRQKILGMDVQVEVQRVRLDAALPALPDLKEYHSGGGQFRYKFGVLEEHPSISVSVMNFHNILAVYAITDAALLTKINGIAAKKKAAIRP